MKPLYKIDESFFEKIDTEHKSYFLGIIFADGYLHEKRNYMSLTLQETDIDILNKLKICIGTDKPLQYIKRKEKNTKNQYRLLISRKKVIKDLINYGVYQNKSLTCTPFKLNNINDELKKHFIRGYFDGDGSVTYYKTRNSINSTINICCTIEFYDFFSSYIDKLLQIKTVKSKRFKDDKNCFDLRICGNRNVITFLDYIYSDCDIFLNRKWYKFQTFKKIYSKTVNILMGDKVSITVKINNETKQFKSFKDAASYFKIPLTSFKRNINKHIDYLGYNWNIIRK